MRLTLTALEDRTTPTLWTGAVSTDALDPNNWMGGELPGQGGAAEFGGAYSTDCVGLAGQIGVLYLDPGYNGTVTLGGAATIGELMIWGGVLVAPDSLTIGNRAGVSDGTLIAQSDVSGRGLGVFTGEVTIQGSATLDVLNIYSPGGSVTLAGGGTVGNLWMESGTSGALSLGAPVTAGGFNLGGGEVRQAAGADLTVTRDFTWTGGTLNSTANDATVNILGGGTITLPGEGNTLTTGSTLNFASVGGATQTIIDGAGTLLLNGTSEDGMFVRADTKVELRLSTGTENKIDGAGKKVTLDTDSEWEYTGAGTRGLALRVINNGGLFKLSGQTHIKATGGSAGAGLVIPSYRNSDEQTARLHITSGCILETSYGVEIAGGSIFLLTNSTLSGADQVATIKGKLVVAKGDIVFSGLLTVGSATFYGKLTLDGDVLWTGGNYRPCIEIGGTKANLWEVTGTMIVDASNATNKPRIEPNFPANQQPTGTWAVIEAVGTGSLNGDNPQIPQGWNLDTTSDANNVKKKWSVRK